MEENDKLNLEAVEELILDEEKLVTYLYVSQKLCIHVNESKKILSDIVKRKLSTHPKDVLHVKYIVSGLIGSNNARTIVCSEIELPKVRKDFKLVFFEHVYCASKSSIDDNLILSVVNDYSNVQSCLGTVKNSSCSKYSDAEINKNKNMSYNASLSKIVQKPALFNKTKKEIVQPKEEKIEKKLETNVKIETKSIDQVEVSPKKKPEPSPASKANKNQQQKGITGFFSKQNNVKKEIIQKPKINVSIETKANNTETIPSNCMNSLEKNDDMKMEIDSDESMENNKAKEKNNLSKSSKKDKKSASNKFQNKKKPDKTSVEVLKKTAKVDKKRKRVLHISDSESDDEKKDPFEDEEEQVQIHESEDEIPPTPTTNVVKVVSGAINPKKKRKMVDKVYTDEDGYVLTRKEEVYESCSDNEVPVETKTLEVKNEKENLEIKANGISPTKKKEPKKSKKKVSPPQKGKQSTMMNFFSKK